MDYVAGGGGFGDPIDRNPQAVLKDFGRGWVSRESGSGSTGDLNGGATAVDVAATEARRSEMRNARKNGATPVSGKTSSVSASATAAAPTPALSRRPGDRSDGRVKSSRCGRCGHFYCAANEKYKLYALHRVRI